MLSFKQFSEQLLFHGTSDSNADKIRKNGIEPTSINDTAFLTPVHREAQKYSKIANNGKLGVVFAVSSDKLDKKSIHSNENGIVRYSRTIPKDHLTEI